ncbi:hypothetical protein DITRI_Ditri07aG0031400 [Diplodiscus trichospermus]
MMSKYNCQKRLGAEMQMEVETSIGRFQYSWIWVQNFKQSIVLLSLMNPTLGVILSEAVQPFFHYFLADFDWSAAIQFDMEISFSMEEVEIKHFESRQLDLGCQQEGEGCMLKEEAGGSYSQQPSGNHMPKQEATEVEATELREKGFMEYGCSHYRRRCRIRAPCCGEIFNCRHCHNESKNNINVDQKLRHDLPRHEVSQQVICSLCGTEQEVRQVCINCGVCMGKYFCEACKLFDDDTSKRQYHCDGCGICRIGGRENFFHCYKCGCCYSILLKNSHPCVEGAMHHDCPVCFEFLFESRYDITVLPCGHTIHSECLKEMRDHYQYACPLCSKSVCDMSKVWEKFDEEIAATPMPEPYQNKMVCDLNILLYWTLCFLRYGFQSFAMIVGKSQKFSSISWLKNARIASHTILDKQEAEVARVAAGNDLGDENSALMHHAMGSHQRSNLLGHTHGAHFVLKTCARSGSFNFVYFFPSCHCIAFSSYSPSKAFKFFWGCRVVGLFTIVTPWVSYILNDPIVVLLFVVLSCYVKAFGL